MSNKKIIVTMSVCVDDGTDGHAVVESIMGAVNCLTDVIETRTVSQMVKLNTMKPGHYFDDGVHYNENGSAVKPQKLEWDE